MDCPRCMGALLAKWAGDVEVDVCTGCGGWWLDRGELRKLTARGHRMGPKTERAIDADPPGMPPPIGGNVGLSDRPLPSANVGFSDSPRPSYAPTDLTCPRDGVKLREIEVGGSAAITVDRCPQCGGFWIDHGELDKIVELLGRRAAEPGRDIEQEIGRTTLLSDQRGPSMFERMGDALQGDLDLDHKRDSKHDAKGRGYPKRRKSKKASFLDFVGDLLEEIID